MDIRPHLTLFTNGEDEDVRTAEYLAHQMLHLKTRTLGRNYPGCSVDMYNIGLLNLALQDYYQAKRFLVRALQIQKAEGNRQDILKTLQTLSRLHKKERLIYALKTAC
jgi:hypothetical protein